MGVPDQSFDSAHVVQGLVYNLLDVFEATRDLHSTLRNKEKRDYERNLRSKGYPASRSVKFIEDGQFGSDETIVMDKAAVTRQFELGLQALGAEFAIGDVLSHTGLQAQIISLQNALVMTFLYGPTSSEPISDQLLKISLASRAAGTATVDILAAQQKRQQEAPPPAPGTLHDPIPSSEPVDEPLYPVAVTSDSSSTAAPKEDHGVPRARSGSPVNTTILDGQKRPQPEPPTTGTVSTSRAPSPAVDPVQDDLYCPYAVSLQRHVTQSLAPSIVSDEVPHCPRCQQRLHMSPGKAWEIHKEDDGYSRSFQVSNRFVVKCHRKGPDGQYACVLCSRNAPFVTICGDVKALVNHMMEDHSSRELKHEEDIIEVIEQATRTRRDSAIGYGPSRSSKQSNSVASSRRRRSLPAYERDRDVYELRSSRR